MVLCDLGWFFLICDGSFWSVMILFDLTWLFLICDGPFLSELIFFFFFLKSVSRQPELKIPWLNCEYWVAKKGRCVTFWPLHYLLKKRPDLCTYTQGRRKGKTSEAAASGPWIFGASLSSKKKIIRAEQFYWQVTITFYSC